MPPGADWKKNYVWKIYIELEERTNKHIICQNCTTEFSDLNNKNAAGDIYCTGCKEYVVPFDLDSNQPYIETLAKKGTVTNVIKDDVVDSSVDTF